MIAYEIQLRYVIRGKIQLGKKNCGEKEKNYQKKKFVGYFLGLNFLLDCILSQTEFVSDFLCTFLSCLEQIDAYHH